MHQDLRVLEMCKLLNDCVELVSPDCLLHSSLLLISLFSGEGDPLQRTKSLETAANHFRTAREGEGTRAPKTRWLPAQWHV